MKPVAHVSVAPLAPGKQTCLGGLSGSGGNTPIYPRLGHEVIGLGQPPGASSMKRLTLEVLSHTNTSSATSSVAAVIFAAVGPPRVMRQHHHPTAVIGHQHWSCNGHNSRPCNTIHLAFERAIRRVLTTQRNGYINTTYTSTRIHIHIYV